MIGLIIPNQIKKIIIYLAIIAGFIFTAMKLYDKFQKVESERNRLDNVLKNINMEVAVTKARNGELIYTVNALSVKGSELEIINANLANSLKNLNLHYKDLQSLTNVQYKYVSLIDTIHVTSKLNKYKYPVNKSDKYQELTGYINLPKNLFSTDSIIANNSKNYPYLSDIKYQIKDTLLIIPEFTFKRHWIFWKKVNGVKVHIKSESPYFQLDRLESFQVVK